MKFNPESQNDESNLAFEQIEHIEENDTRLEESGESSKLEKYFNDGFGDEEADEVVLSPEDFEAFMKANGIGLEANNERR